MTVDAKRDYVAIGQLASSIGRPVRAIEQAAESLNLSPAMRVNRVPFFDGEQAEKITAVINNQEQSKCH